MLCRVRGPLQRLRRVNISSLVLFSFLFLVIYNEFLEYVVHSLWWSKLPDHGTREGTVRVLFVADPQLIGNHNENQYVGPFSRWDSDRYLSRTFHMAYSAVDPDAVVFMGDLLDEGSTSSSLTEYSDYYKRFMHIFSVRNTTQRIYLPGDNDVGGEGFDRYASYKVQRFEKFFNKEVGTTPVKFVDFMRMNFQYGNTYDKHTQDEVEYLRRQSHGRVRLLLNHMGVLQRHYGEYNKLLQTLRPSAIFTAHSHLSYVVMCPNCQHREPDPSRRRERIRAISGSDVRTLPGSDTSGYTEIVVPTCSYRMGVERMGYGAASIGSDGSVHYTVLWVPSRYRQFFLYLVVPSVILLLLVVYFIVSTCIKYRQEFCNMSEEEVRKNHQDLPNFTGCLGYAMRAIHFSLFCCSQLQISRRR